MIRLGNLYKKIVCIIMPVAMTACMLPVAAFASVEIDENGNLEVTANNTTQYFSSNDDFTSALISSSGEEGKAEVSIGNVTGTGEEEGLAVESNGSSLSMVEAGDVAGNLVISSFAGNYYGEGSIENYKANNIDDPSDTGNETPVEGSHSQTGNIGGNVNVNSILGGAASLDCGNIEGGIKLVNFDAIAQIMAGNVKNGLETANLFGLTGIAAGDVSGEEIGLVSYNYGGDSWIITQNIKGGDVGLVAHSTDGFTSILVNGDVEGTKGVGIWEGVGILEGLQNNNVIMRKSSTVESEGNDEQGIQMVVMGTVKGSAENCVGVFTNDDGSNFDLVVWKIEPNAKGNVAEKIAEDGSDETVKNAEFEKNISYIIRIDTPAEGASLSATKADGSALEFLQNGYGNILQVANENDIVLFKIDLENGYELKAAYGDDGKAVPLVADANGNYYVVVPKGGGVLLSIVVSKIAAPSEFIPLPASTANESTGNSSVTEPAKPQATEDNSVFNNRIARMILNAAQGETIKITLTEGLSIGKEMLDALKARPDTSLTITFFFNGQLYTVTIPAGADIDSLRNASGGVDIYVLVSAFGMEPA